MNNMRRIKKEKQEGPLKENSFIQNHTHSLLPLCTMLLLLALVILVLLCFAAVTYDAANEKFATGQKALSETSGYYAAETTAVEIISDFFNDKNSGINTQNGIMDQKSRQGMIEVMKIDSDIYFSIPVEKNKALSVGAEVTKDSIIITKWFIKDI